MYRILSRIYQTMNGVLLAKLPRRLQRRIKAPALAMARQLFPQQLHGLSVDTFMPVNSSGEPGWQPPQLPDWVKAEMAEIAATIDPSLHPQTERSQSIEFYSIPYAYERPGAIYSELWQQVPEAVDTVVLVPWLKPGGADLGALHFVQALQLDFRRKVLVIATEPQDSPWASRLPSEASFIAAGNALSVCAEDERQTILARLMVQLAPRTIHVMNSLLGWQTVQRYGKAMRQTSRLYASLYCDDITPAGYLDGYAQRFLVECSQHLDGVITDNHRNYRDWIRSMGVPASMFSVVPFPAVGGNAVSGGADLVDVKPAVLWAGRLDRQKRPDLLARIAAAMPEIDFDVYGSNVIRQESVDLKALQALPNVHLHGGYDDFGAIVQARHVAFAYTTAWDGMPNILLEAARAGLPIIAPDLGGIADFLPTQWLVADAEDVDAYVVQLRRLAGDAAERRERVEKQRKLLENQRGWSHFLLSLEQVPGYLSAPVGESR
ncbi:MAG: glycosyltransferase family 4 protein [Rhodanobacter sp.]